ncbi:hypothetical protein PanWU01x14_066860 [Parasponia andersonii]|uniref:Uncharacterized protein n=1 Tax=Parasponia andersonii TaxID=3476 RepID=A0A2P5DG88_PARAD|nr:hypothetical protein PanWU01x14_066860 [Parasponia andersonii]
MVDGGMSRRRGNEEISDLGSPFIIINIANGVAQMVTTLLFFVYEQFSQMGQAVSI